ncbi:MAG: hypothetical protein HY800_01485 [Ignavibacteriales bacterium]|nr:hypothetical protein [Ignavibacteriales bacterium]
MIIEKYYKELINKEVDGANSSSESKKLIEYLNTNPEARKFYNDLDILSHILSEVKEIDPPQNLKKNILNVISLDTHSTKKVRPIVRFTFATLLVGKKFRYAYVFAAGIAAGIIIILFTLGILEEKRPVDITDLYGTMLVDTKPGNFLRADKIEINMTNIVGNLELSYSNEVILIEIVLKTERRITFNLDFNNENVNFLGFKKFNNVINEMEVGEKSLQFSNHGENRYLLAFGRKAFTLSTMKVKIYSSDIMIYEEEIFKSSK